MHLKRGRAIFQCIAFAERPVRQFARLAHRDEAATQTAGQRRADDETAGLDSGNGVDRFSGIAPGKNLDQGVKRRTILKQGRDVTKLDAGCRPVGNGTDQGTEIVGRHGFHGAQKFFRDAVP